MRNKLIKQIFIACMAVFVMSFGMMLVAMTDYYGRKSQKEMQENAAFLASLLNAQDWQFLEEMEHQSDLRITLVSPEGAVIFDSLHPAQTLGNHGDREEIQMALQQGEGRSVRYSETLQKRTDNYAVRLENGSVLRLSIVPHVVPELILSMLNPMLVVIFMAMLLSVVLASQFAKRIMQPINRLDVENPDDRYLYDEMKPFVHRIMAQNKQIYKQMSELKEEHSKQDEMRREFTANVSHELKTPLTSISGFAEIIRDGFVQEKDIPHFADNIYNEAQRLIVLVNDILKLSRLEEGVTVQDEMTNVELKSLCEEVSQRLALNAEKCGVQLTCGGVPAEIQGVRNMIEEIIYNVCDNAIKYNREGGSVAISVETVENKACVRVKDTGIGIPKADIDRVFERFYRVNKSHSKEVGGTGLGLSIVKHGMAFHNASITIESEVDVGTEICLYFPMKEGGEPPQVSCFA
ncbi:MAG: ATP-binding protein [Oscillospiraceae bacterium]|nr:ATP-binding protein [Oscillospiraceae bacterium]